jgi:hypothetical protein
MLFDEHWITVQYHHLKEKDIPIVKQVDVVIVGGGTAGSVASIASGREGMSTLVVEQLGCLGGTQTSALVTPQMPNQINNAPLNLGIDAEINARLAATHDGGTFSDGNRGWFNPEMLKFVLEDMLDRARVELLYYTFFSDAIVEGNTIKGIIVQNKAGQGAILAKRVIDASGDADVALRAGVPCDSGEKLTGVNQPFSVRFHLGNVDIGRFIDFLKDLGSYQLTENATGSEIPLVTTAQVWGKGWNLEPLFRRAVEAGVLKESDGNYFQVFSVPGRPGEISFNCPRVSGEVDGTNPFHLTKAQLLGRQAIKRYLNFCRKYLPGFENAYIVLTAPLVGVRESRRIIGEYVLTVDDVLGAKKFEDAIARNNYPIDIHRDKESGAKIIHLKPGEYHEIPYRCLVPLRIDNLLVAGRCISATFEAQGSIRIQTNCRAMGEAAGVAAAMSILRNLSPKQLDGAELRMRLREQGGNL